MKLRVIDIDENKNHDLRISDECASILDVYPDYYRRVGFNLPWVSYFFEYRDQWVGCGGFKGKPKRGKVEISYGTFKGFQGQGIGTVICKQLVLLSLRTDPQVRITARTLIGKSGSTTILARNGFDCLGVVHDEEDGAVWEWEFKRD